MQQWFQDIRPHAITDISPEREETNEIPGHSGRWQAEAGGLPELRRWS